MQKQEVKKVPRWLVKAMWAATAVKFKVYAKDEAGAWDCAWKQVSKMFGGDSCLRVIVLRRVE